MYDASPPDLPVELSPSQARRVVARRTSLLGDTLKPPSAAPTSNQISPHPDLQPSITPVTPPQPDYPAFESEGVPLAPSPQDPQPTVSASFAHIQPLQKGPDHIQPHTTHPHYRPHQEAYHDHIRPSDSSSNRNQDEATAETSVVVRTATLVPSSPLLKSTVADSATSGARSYPQSDHSIQADLTSPYYTFQDTRLVPNPIIRIYLANSVNPKMFSLQNISPDTLGLLLSVFIQVCELVREVTDFVTFSFKSSFQPVRVCLPPDSVRHLLSYCETPSDHSW